MLEARSQDIESVGIEDPDAENADDVTVYMKDGKRECYQAKYSTDASRPATLEWLTESKPGGRSMVQGFYELWKGAEIKPRITLATNRPPDGDPLAGLADGDDDTVARRLEHAKPGSKEGRLCASLAGHLGASKADTVAFLRDVRFYFRSKGELIGLVKERMGAAGLCNDDDAVARGAGIVRDWTTGGKRRIAREQLLSALEPLKRPPRSTASILIQMIDRDPEPADATVSFYWTRLFPGGEPRARRLPTDPGLWNSKFLPAFKRAARTLRSQNHTYVVVEGYMRLPTWFAVGSELSKTAGFEVTCTQNLDEWSSAGEPSDVAIEHDVEALDPGPDLAVGVAWSDGLSDGLSRDVSAYIREERIGAGRHVSIRPPGGAGGRSIGGAAEARGWALGARDLIRGLAREYRPDRMHLFLAGPHGAALLLGHLWNRMPPTQLYEDLGYEGYAPSYLIPA